MLCSVYKVQSTFRKNKSAFRIIEYLHFRQWHFVKLTVSALLKIIFLTWIFQTLRHVSGLDFKLSREFLRIIELWTKESQLYLWISSSLLFECCFLLSSFVWLLYFYYVVVAVVVISHVYNNFLFLHKFVMAWTLLECDVCVFVFVFAVLVC